MTDDHDLYETDSEWMVAWERWAETQQSRHPDYELKLMWDRYLAQNLDSMGQYYSGQYINEAYQQGTLRQYRRPADFPKFPPEIDQ